MKKILTVVFLIFISSCASNNSSNVTGYNVSKDKFNGHERYSMVQEGSLSGTPFLSLSEVYIDLFADSINNQLSLTFAIILNFEDWAFINSGESLILLIDDNPIKLNSAQGSLLNRGILGGVHGAIGKTRIKEEAHYPITVNDIRILANAKRVEVRIYGQKQSVTRELNKKHIESIKRFYESYILASNIKSI